ncbi:DUF2637 domain-containing protein [Streptacidiphilus sp. MAP5-52]|uniref:DUF2637 domain-containing protein n=1 Tax=Streptacidiphilus sp. MAP5-52 TaxID=3156267 RepID=UPI0035184F2A
MSAPRRRMSIWDVAGIGLLGAVGFSLSYDALQQTAQAIHVRGDLTYAFPLIIDGFIAYGVRALVLLREAKWSARLYAWSLFAGATAVSIWANALHAITLNEQETQHLAFHLQNQAVGALSTLAPLGLAGSVHLYILVARNAHQDQPGDPADLTEAADDASISREPPPQNPLRGLITRLVRTARRDRSLERTLTSPALPAAADNGPRDQVAPLRGPSGSSGGPQSPGPSGSSGGPQSPGPSGSSGGPQSPGPSGSSGGPQSPGPSGSSGGPQAPGPSGSSGGPQAPGPSGSSGEDLAWLPVVRAAADRAGSATRKAVSTELRSSGHPISNRRLGLLLQALKDEQAPPASGSPPPVTVRPPQPPNTPRTRKH